jgi:hypothetical protein
MAGPMRSIRALAGALGASSSLVAAGAVVLTVLGAGLSFHGWPGRSHDRAARSPAIEMSGSAARPAHAAPAIAPVLTPRTALARRTTRATPRTGVRAGQGVRRPVASRHRRTPATTLAPRPAAPAPATTPSATGPTPAPAVPATPAVPAVPAAPDPRPVVESVTQAAAGAVQQTTQAAADAVRPVAPPVADVVGQAGQAASGVLGGLGGGRN